MRLPGKVKARGLEPRSRVLEFGALKAPGQIGSRLHLAADRMVQRIVGMGTARGEPLVLETAHVPRALAEGMDPSVLERASIWNERRYGMRVTREHETIRPTDQAVEWQESIVRGDRFLYSVELNRREAEPLWHCMLASMAQAQPSGARLASQGRASHWTDWTDSFRMLRNEFHDQRYDR